jgi:hypothetical protein
MNQSELHSGCQYAQCAIPSDGRIAHSDVVRAVRIERTTNGLEDLPPAETQHAHHFPVAHKNGIPASGDTTGDTTEGQLFASRSASGRFESDTLAIWLRNLLPPGRPRRISQMTGQLQPNIVTFPSMLP